MPALPPLTFKGGLNTSPMTAGQDDLAACKNVFYYNGALMKRRGARFARMMNTWDDLTPPPEIVAGFATMPAEPTTLAGYTAGLVTSTVSAAHTDDVIYVSSADITQILYFQLGCDTYSKTANAAAVKSLYERAKDLIVEIWNGTTWTTVKWFPCFEPEYSSGSIVTSPMFPVSISGSYNTATAVGLSKNLCGVIVPPTGVNDWQSKTIATVSSYWLRIRGFNFTLFRTGAPSADVLRADNAAAASARVALSVPYVAPAFNGVQKVPPRRDVKCLLYFRDRQGRPHEFSAQINFYKDTTAYTFVGYQLDGVTLVQTDALRPDTGSFFAGLYSSSTVINAFYHPPTDRVIGYVQGLGWFYAIAQGNGEIYAFFPSKDGVNTAYASLPGGLRSVIPDGTISAFHDGRIWTTFGVGSHKVAYSAPGVYADIWPNDFELDLSDSVGGITGMCSLNGVLVVFKDSAIYTVYASGDSDAYQFDRVPGSFGCVATKSIVVIGNICIFLGKDGLYAFDGQQVKLISDKVHNFFNSPSFSSDPTAAIACYMAPYHQYRLFYPSPSSGGVCDSALYCEIGSLIGAGDGPVSFWPQGRKVVDDYGFNATAVAIDESQPTPRMMVGDAFGTVWEHDNGDNDPTEPVKASFTSARIGLGASRRNLVRFVTPTFIADTNLAMTIESAVDGDKENAVSDATSPQGDNRDSAFYAASETVSTGDTYDQLLDLQSVRSSDLKTLGRFIQIVANHDVEAPMSLTSVEIIVQPYGKGQI